jgi:hypothetical protein
MMREFTDDSKWHCDICLSAESEDDDPLTQCDLCMLVVHPACYRRDLYLNEDMKDDEPWFCAKCKLITDAEYKSNKLQKP